MAVVALSHSLRAGRVTTTSRRLRFAPLGAAGATCAVSKRALLRARGLAVFLVPRHGREMFICGRVSNEIEIDFGSAWEQGADGRFATMIWA